MPFWKSYIEYFWKLLILRGWVWGRSPRSHNSFADDPQGTWKSDTTNAGFTLTWEQKSCSQHGFIDHCTLSSASGIQREIKVKGQKLSTVTSFKYLGGSYFTSWLKTRSCLKHCTRHCSPYIYIYLPLPIKCMAKIGIVTLWKTESRKQKAEANLER